MKGIAHLGIPPLPGKQFRHTVCLKVLVAPPKCGLQALHRDTPDVGAHRRLSFVLYACDTRSTEFSDLIPELYNHRPPTGVTVERMLSTKRLQGAPVQSGTIAFFDQDIIHRGPMNEHETDWRISLFGMLSEKSEREDAQQDEYQRFIWEDVHDVYGAGSLELRDCLLENEDHMPFLTMPDEWCAAVFKAWKERGYSGYDFNKERWIIRPKQKRAARQAALERQKQQIDAAAAQP
jgi:hypothetical protein